MHVETLELTGREAEQRIRRVQRGAEREELLALLEELEWWYRDLVVVAAGAEGAAVHVDRLAELREDATHERLIGFLYSTSVLSKIALGSHVSAFEGDLRDRLSQVAPDNVVRESIGFHYTLARLV